MAIVKSHKIDFKKKINQEIMAVIIICTLQKNSKRPKAVMKLAPAEQHSSIIYSDRAGSSVVY